MKHHKKASKRTKLSLKYNIQKRVRENKRRVRKEAKKLGVTKTGMKKGKDPGIPNTWPFKAEMLQDLQRQKEKKEADIVKTRAEAKAKAHKAKKTAEADKKRELKARDEERRLKRTEEIAQSRQESLRKVLMTSDVFLEVLDARDPLGCRCAEFEAWARDNGKRVIFVLAKADLVDPQIVAQWLQALCREGPAVAVQVEAGREGVADLVRLLGRPAKTPPAVASAAPPAGTVPEAQAVGVVGYATTGKKALCKAMRQEGKAGAKWLLETIGRFLGPVVEPDAPAALHATMRGEQAKGAAWDKATATASSGALSGPLATVNHLLERSQEAHFMRRFRLPAFANCEEMLRAFAKNRDMKSKKGKVAAVEAVARRLLAELAQAPGCCCAPPAEAAAAAGALWKAHAGVSPTAQATLQKFMEAQVAAFTAREAGPHHGALVLTSRGAGPAVDVAGILAGIEPEESDDEAMDADGSEDGDGGEDEGGEEEEGEESEEEDGMSDEEV